MKKSALFASLCLLLTSTLLSFSPVIVNAATTPKTAQLYGDSLTYESTSAINNQFAIKKGWTGRVHAYPGTALCDWLPWLSADIASYHPSVISVETAVNTTRPCMLDSNGAALPRGSAALYAKFRSDLNSFFATATASGAKVVYIVAPPMKETAWNNDINQALVIATELAANYHGVSIAKAPRNAVSNSGKFVAYKACLLTETAAQGCGADKKIAIRTIGGLQDGIHFCPNGLQAAYPFICNVYSSGELRFGKSVANTVANPPAPVLP